MSGAPDIDYKAEINRHFAWLEARLPHGPARFMNWLRRPSSKLVRLPLGILLVLGGIFSILPLLGLWMLPLGLILLAQDIPLLEKPVAQLLGWFERKWLARQRAKQVASEISGNKRGSHDARSSDSSVDRR